jgi:hypothetical protein
VETAGNVTTASNYAEDFENLVPVHPEWKNGPFVRDPSKPLPSRYVLTKTHCAAYCMNCPTHNYVLDLDTFDAACRTAKIRNDRGDTETLTYNASIPTRALHLFRSPFDNLVGRFHLSQELRKSRGETTGVGYSNSRDGLTSWCRNLDATFREDELSSGLLDPDFLTRHGQFPCHAEWFRFAQWHNMAYQVTQRHSLPTHYLFYENYTKNYEGTVQSLFEFLEIEPVLDFLPFKSSKSYGSFFDTEYGQAAARLVQDQALPAVWSLVEHYFAPYVNSEPEAQTPSANREFDKRTPQVAWLLSFPNSGTTFTLKNTGSMSNRSVASNYGREFEHALPVRPDLIHGPYVSLPLAHELPPTSILTKTHCGGFCDNCVPEGFVFDLPRFALWCTRGSKKIEGTKKQTFYNLTVPTKAVHLVRSPFDNLIARVHYSTRKHGNESQWSPEQRASFSNDREGYLAWCSHLDGLHVEEFRESTFFSDEVKAAFRDVPCFAEWFRYVQWHNNAIKLTQIMQLPVHIVRYEKYTTDFEKTANDLLDFLELPAVGPPASFLPGKTYGDFFSREEAQAAKRLVQLVATTDCWDLISNYFDPWV